MLFLILIMLGVLALAGNVIFFSVWGLAQTFTYTAFFWGSAIEGGKLLIASFLYRFWNTIHWGTRLFGCFLVAGLMIITSFGIYGHILSGHQEKNVEIQAQSIKITEAQERLNRYRERLSDVESEITITREEISEMNDSINDISNRDDAYITARSGAADVIRQDRVELQERLSELQDQREQIYSDMEPHQERVTELESEMLNVETKVGPIVTLIEMLGANGEKATLWFILLIVLMFDPAAVYLTVQANRVSLSLSSRNDGDSDGESIDPDNTPSPADRGSNPEDNKNLEDAISKLVDSSERNSEIIGKIQNRMEQRDKKELLKKEITKD